jgi:hypothetical protein
VGDARGDHARHGPLPAAAAPASAAIRRRALARSAPSS